MRIRTKLIGVLSVVAGLLVCARCSMSADEDGPTPANAVNGLSLRLQLSTAKEGEKLVPQCVMVIENVGQTDLNVNLGCSLSNGKSHHPTALRLFVHREGAKTRTLTYSVRVAGRLDPFIVPLPAGSTYTLRIPFNKFADTETGLPIDLTANDDRIAVELVGAAVTERDVSSDFQGLALMTFWQGKASSEEVQLTFAK